MAKNFFYTLLIIAMIFASCTNNSQPANVEKWTEDQVNEWFDSSGWATGLQMKPDASINKKILAQQNILNPRAWQAAFAFLQKNNFEKMDTGRYQLSDDGTYASVADYLTKDPDTAFYEAHKKFIDIQYVPVGKEYIGLTNLESMEIVQPYDAQNDIMFFRKADTQMLLADSSRFFVFFPSDGHKPCLKVDRNTMARKIVVKVPVAEQ